MTKNITFTLPAVAMEGATEAFLLGDFNNWNPENALKLEKQKDGSYQTVAKLEEGKTYQYRFLLNDGRWINDYNAQNYTPAHGFNVENSEITVPVSDKKESKKATPAKAAPTAAKEVKIKEEKKAAAPAKKVTKKAAPKKAAPAKSAKPAAPKAAPAKAEKTAKPVAKKAVAKAAPKAKK